MSLSLNVTLQAVILLPLVAVAGIALAGSSRPNLREAMSFGGGALTFALVWKLYRAFLDGQSPGSHWIEVLPGLAIAFSVDALGLLFALIASFLWMVTIVYAIGYMRGHGEQNQTRFYGFFAVAISGVMGIAFADNLFTLFVFYEMVTLSTYPLVTHAGTDKARGGGRVYLTILLVTSIVFFLPAMIGTWVVAGTLDFSPGGIFPSHVSPMVLSVLLVLFVIGVGKAAVMPVHRWLPAAMVAPTPVSALLHAVAVVKAGVFTVMKVVIFIFGTDTIKSLLITDVLLYLVGFSILAASLVALHKDNLKARLAYSTVSQLGYITLGVLLANSAGITGSAMHIAMHAFGKITLFFCAGAILVAHHKSDISQMEGLGRAMPITMSAFFVASLSIIGLPPAGGAWSKWYLLLGTFDASMLVLMAVLMVSSLLNIAYLLPIPLRAFFPRPGTDTDYEGVREAPLAALVAIVMTALATLMLFLFPQPLHDLVGRIWS
jgi:multicomponent Na+:H+ antiporter subunit D